MEMPVQRPSRCAVTAPLLPATAATARNAPQSQTLWPPRMVRDRCSMSAHSPAAAPPQYSLPSKAPATPRTEQRIDHASEARVTASLRQLLDQDDSMTDARPGVRIPSDQGTPGRGTGRPSETDSEPAVKRDSVRILTCRRTIADACAGRWV